MKIDEISFITKDKNIKTFSTNQMHIFWLPDEIPVEKDVQDILVNMTESEKHGIITTLKLFTMYEVFAGEEYWGGRYRKIFPNDIEHLEMASIFSMVEMAIHAPFYKKLNELLYLDTDEFYSSYIENDVLRSRMEFINDMVNSDNDLLSLAIFSLIEGSILYSSFAFLKHFQTKGKNKLMNVVRGINFSVRDENIHSLAGAYSFVKLLKQSNLSKDEYSKLRKDVEEACIKIFEHESKICDMIFEKGNIDGITSTQMKYFVQSRINMCLKNLEMNEVYEVTYNPIAEDFYNGIVGLQSNDFFTSVSGMYSRDWVETKFLWK